MNRVKMETSATHIVQNLQQLKVLTTCERSGNIVTPACPPTTGTLTSLGSSPRTSPCKQRRAGIRIGETVHVETSSDIIGQRYNKEIGKYGKLF
jgi:hypothetical protein